MKNYIIGWAAVFGLTSSLQANALSLAGLNVEPQVHTETVSLTLNGAAIRWGRGGRGEYVVALYLQRPTVDVHQVLASNQPTRIHMIFLERFSSYRVARGLGEELTMNLEPPVFAQIKPQLDQLIALAPSQFVRGDKIELDFLPDQGTRVIINGVVLGILPGRELYTGLLSLWLGPRAVSREFKAALLAGAVLPPE